MAIQVKPLTVTEIKNAKPRAKQFNYQRPFINKRTNLSFGSFPDISLVKARQMRVSF